MPYRNGISKKYAYHEKTSIINHSSGTVSYTHLDVYKRQIEGADEAVIYISIATNFTNYKDITGNQVERAKNYLRRAVIKII